MYKIALLGAAAAVAGVSLAAVSDTVPAAAPGTVTVTGGTGGAATNEATTATANGAAAELAMRPQGMTLGAQTHFSQSWPAAWLPLAGQIGAKTLRDSIPWSTVEKAKGTYDFSAASIKPLATHCAAGGTLSLTLVPRNSLYDGNLSVYTDAGRLGFANYIKALMGKFGNCIEAIEVGNEINTSGLVYPSGMNKATTYVASLKTISDVVKPYYPKLTILGGSSNMIATGFLETLFAVGGMKVMDAVAVHPYRGDAESTDLEIANLNTVMRKYGEPLPIWATEFSYDTTDTRFAAAGLVKQTVQMSAAGVARAYWYALVDQAGFPNMGLFTKSMTPKPQATAFKVLSEKLLPYGRPVRVNTGDDLTYLYRFGQDRWLVWGAPRTVAFSGPASISDIMGNPLPAGTVNIGAEPVIVEGATGYNLLPTNVVADTLLQYGGGGWSYFRRGKTGGDITLPIYDNDYTSFFGDRWSKPLRLNINSGAPAGDGTNPMNAGLRWTATTEQKLDLNMCISKAVSGDGITYTVLRNGVRVTSGTVTESGAVAVPVNVSPGTTVDFLFGPNKTFGGDSFWYRAVLSRRNSGKPLSCAFVR